MAIYSRRKIGKLATDYRFYKLPKYLFTDCKISNSAKILYAVLLDRCYLSDLSGLSNDFGEVFVLMSREEMSQILGKSTRSVTKIINELIKNGLIEEENKRHRRELNQIYLRMPS